MNPLQLSARYLKGYGANRGIQEAVDYGLGAAIGAGGQQLMNWTTQGADPNPLLSGALFSPVGAVLVRSGRGLNASGLYSGDKRNLALLGNQLTNPYTQAALGGSLAGMAGGAGTSIYNTVADGDDVDNNLVAGGLALLGGVAPIAASMMTASRPRVDTSFQPPNRAIGLGSTSSGTYAYDSVNAPYSNYTGRPQWSGETTSSKNQNPYRG